MANLVLKNSSWAKVIFLQACVCPRGGCLPQCMLGCHPSPPRPGTPLDQAPPREQTPPQEQTPRPGTPWEKTPPGSRHPPGADSPGPGTPLESRLQHTVNEQPVRILLECILVQWWNQHVVAIEFLSIIPKIFLLIGYFIEIYGTD